MDLDLNTCKPKTAKALLADKPDDFRLGDGPVYKTVYKTYVKNLKVISPHLVFKRACLFQLNRLNKITSYNVSLDLFQGNALGKQHFNQPYCIKSSAVHC